MLSTYFINQIDCLLLIAKSQSISLASTFACRFRSLHPCMSDSISQWHLVCSGTVRCLLRDDTGLVVSGWNPVLSWSYILDSVHCINCPPHNTLAKVVNTYLIAQWLLRREDLLRISTQKLIWRTSRYPLHHSV